AATVTQPAPATGTPPRRWHSRAPRPPIPDPRYHSPRRSIRMRSWSYEALGVRPVINAAATLTRLGGSRMPPDVVEALSPGATSFVDLTELQRGVGERIAERTHNEACYVSSGAAAGIALAVAACSVGTDPAGIARLPNVDGAPPEVIIHRCQRNG